MSKRRRLEKEADQVVVLPNSPKLPKAWGAPQLVSDLDAHDFWTLMDELVDDKSGFYHNRATLLDALKDGCLYGLCFSETDYMYDNLRTIREFPPPFLCHGDECRQYLLPCFCMVDIKGGKKAKVIWTHTRARRRGFGTALVKNLGIEEVNKPVDGSQPFWEACGLWMQGEN